MSYPDLKKVLGAIPSPIFDSKRHLYMLRTPTKEENKLTPTTFSDLVKYHNPNGYTQGNVGSCTGLAAKVLREQILRIISKYTELSGGWLYKKGREEANIIDNSQDGGTCLGVLKAMNHYGSLLEADFPTDITSPFNYNQNEPDNWENLADDYGIDSYHQVPTDPPSMKAAMYGITHPLPYKMPDGSQGKAGLYCAIPIYSRIVEAYDNGGVVPSPNWFDQPIGYHAIDFDEWKITDGKEYWWTQNTWGKDVGDNGRFGFEMNNYRVIEAWLIHPGNVVKPESGCFEGCFQLNWLWKRKKLY